VGVATRKSKETEALRQRALDEVEDIFVREGAQNVTMRRIARRIDYAPTVLYRLFANKDDLMDHLIARGYEGVRAGYEEILLQDLDPLEALRRILLHYTEYALEHPNHYRMWFDSGHIRKKRHKLELNHGRLKFIVFQTWLDGLAACTEAGYLPEREPQELFQILWARVHGLISLRIQHPNFSWLPLEQHLEEVLALNTLGGSESS
jgi:AcrR family transcriptional regulator